MAVRRLDLVPTPAGWAAIALRDVEGLLSDHAHCEKKAAQTALNLVHALTTHDEMVMRLARLAEQETEHLRRVVEVIHGLGLHLRHDEGNPYAQTLARQAHDVVDRCIAAACIEARSHERLELLAIETARRGDLTHLRPLFDELRAAEAGHAHTYLEIAAAVRDVRTVERRLPVWVAREAAAIGGVEARAAVH